MTDTNKHLNDSAIDAHDQALQNQLVSLEKKGDSDEQDEFLEADEDKKDHTDYSGFSKSDFVQKAEQLMSVPNITEAHDAFKKIRVLFDDMVKAERADLLKAWAEAGNDVRAFKPPVDELKDQFYKHYTKFLERRADEKKRAEEEKQKNYLAKKTIIEQLKQLSDSDETEAVFAQVLDLQKQWRQIRTVPKEFMNELWENYRLYLDKFYDNHAINNELKEKDRQKNLEIKIELIKKVDALGAEKSIKKAHILLNKYHEDFKNTGPVTGKEVAEDIWKRFKEASDKVLNEKRQALELIKAKRQDNFELKKVICEKAELMGQMNFTSPKQWKEKQDEMAALFAEWKGIGPVPESVNDQIWKRFREAQNVFNQNKRKFFDGLNNSKDANLKAKLTLCEQAEALSSNTQYDSTSKQLIALQERWKTIGPVPESQNELVWARFRAACDSFFKRRDEFYKGRQQEEKVNQGLKTELIAKVQALLEEADAQKAFEALKGLQQAWMSIGFVPMKVKNDLQTQYSKAVDAIYKKHKATTDANKSSRFKEHLEMLSAAPNSADKLKQEERAVQDKIRAIKEDCETLKNNIEFFAKSKNADALKKQIEQKIESANAQIKKLNEELSMIRAFRQPKA